MSDEPAYSSSVVHTPLTGAEPLSPPWDSWRTATVTDTDDPELAELRRRVVEPVVASVITAEELDAVLVYEDPHTHEIRVRVQARGEELHHWVQMERSLPVDDVALAAERFAGELEDFTAESRFGWGQQRIARYEIPPA
ncbi:MAG: hypothetical protein ABJA16_03500 [Nakamurella sp.]